jgi:hypothetical protein
LFVDGVPAERYRCHDGQYHHSNLQRNPQYSTRKSIHPATPLSLRLLTPIMLRVLTLAHGQSLPTSPLPASFVLRSQRS